MTELFIPRQGRNLPTRPLQGIPRMRPGDPLRCVPVRPSTLLPAIGDATGPVAVASLGDRVPAGEDGGPAGPGTPRVRRGGPRHGRRASRARRAGPVLAGAVGLALGLGLGTTGWVLHARLDRRADSTERQVAVAEVRLAQPEQPPPAGSVRGTRP